ncbi:hypothetical protein DL98DRAFT_515719 [Cadophora sp. DSE1049]|nr:hypothetical protein DL98DRAFT_515719 [Cadophora sp. DSE1049]
MARRSLQARLRRLAIRQRDNATTELAQPTEQSELPEPPESTPRGRSPHNPERDSEWYAKFRAWKYRDKSPLTWMHQREPGPDASHFDEFVCYALNKLQEPLKPHRGLEINCFRSESEEPIKLCEEYDTWNEVCLTYISITALKYRGVSGDMIYTLEATVVCYGDDRHQTWSRDAVGGLEVSVTTEWMNDKNIPSEYGTGSKWDWMDFDEALLLLRRAAKKKFNRFGELRR